MLAEKARGVRRQWSHLPQATIDELAQRQIESELRGTLQLPSFDEFVARNPQTSLFE
jgi:hypothetical protein